MQHEEPSAPTPKQGFFDRLEKRIRSWSSNNPFAQQSITLYQRHQRYVPALFFFSGVAWDSATLDRIDALFDTVFLLTYIIVLGGLVFLALLVERGDIKNEKLLKYRTWYPPAIQFFLGALFSAYFIFYLQSTSIQSEGIVFIVVLLVLLVANEFLHNRLLNPYLLFALYYLACVSFFIFFLPTVFKDLSYWVFLLSCLVGLVITGMMLFLLKKKQAFRRKKPVYYIASILVVLFTMLNLFYMKNWIPPVPLSLRAGDVFRDVERQGDGFVLSYATPEWYKFWVDSDQEYFYAEGDTVYAFAAIFAPTELETNIFHVWNHFDPDQEDWVQTDEIAVEIEGGRNTGYRTYTRKRFVTPGKWRVDVKTEDQRILGRIPFNIIQVDSTVTTLSQRIYH